MANERDILFGIGEYMSLPFNYSLCECYKWNTKQRAALQAEVNGIREALKKLQASAHAEAPCPQTDYISHLLSTLQQYLESIQSAVSSDCCRPRSAKAEADRNATGIVDLIGTQFQTNLKANGWCYGTFTPDLVRLSSFARMVNLNVTNCPLDLPYFSGKRCVKCNRGLIFDLSRKKCLKPVEFDEASKRCRVNYGEADREIAEEYSMIAPKLIQGKNEDQETVSGQVAEPPQTPQPKPEPNSKPILRQIPK